jgi:hypothetical protein
VKFSGHYLVIYFVGTIEFVIGASRLATLKSIPLRYDFNFIKGIV